MSGACVCGHADMADDAMLGDGACSSDLLCCALTLAHIAASIRIGLKIFFLVGYVGNLLREIGTDLYIDSYRNLDICHIVCMTTKAMILGEEKSEGGGTHT